MGIWHILKRGECYELKTSIFSLIFYSQICIRKTFVGSAVFTRQDNPKFHKLTNYSTYEN